MTTIAAAPTPPQPPARRAAAHNVWFGGNMPVARLGLIISLLVPMALLIADACNHQLGANAVNFAIHTTGGISVICLLLCLCVTPLRNVTGFSWLVQFRRSLGVYAFYYAAAHLAIYFWWDRQRDLASTVFEITHRFYLGIGLWSLLLMMPLWATSFNAAIQKMGGTWWKRLHRLTYLAAALACYHFYLQSKADKRLPDLAFAVLGGLLLWRVAAAVLHRRRGTSAAATALARPGIARFWKGELRVVGMVRETAAVRTFQLAAVDGGPVPFAYRAGQFLNLVVTIEGKRISRSYTIASPPTRTDHLELTIKREDNGQVSRHLHDMLMTGQSVAVTAPAGRFTFDSDSASAVEAGVLLIAGGLGITPVMSILRDLTDRRWPGAIDLVFSVRTADDVIFAGELKRLAETNPNVHVHITVTRDAPADWTGHRGRITAALLGQLVPEFNRRMSFICGPDAMATAARDELVRAGMPAERIVLESFTPAAAVASDAGVNPDAEMNDAAAVTVTFTQTGRTAALAAGKTILDAAENAGVQIDYQCRSGVCGTCITRLTAGRVTMEMREALSDADETAGYILACQARAVEDVSVDA